MVDTVHRRGAPHGDLIFDQFLGEGASAKVWRATWSGKQVAVKVVGVDEVFEDESLEDFRNECAMLKQVSMH
eukprot:SAG31_NODE_4935_length_2851_cov_2.089753_4_plen_72_part_00